MGVGREERISGGAETEHLGVRRLKAEACWGPVNFVFDFGSLESRRVVGE